MGWLKCLKRRRQDQWDPQTPLFYLEKDVSITVGQAMEHIHVFGATGSSKSTSSFALASEAALRKGFSALFCTVKASDVDAYIRRCREAGRERDVILFGPGYDARYNPFEAELLRTDAGGRSARSIVDLIITLLEVSSRGAADDSGENAGYFKAVMNEMVTCAVDLLIKSVGDVSIPLISDIIFSAPLSVAMGYSEEYRKTSFCWRCIELASQRPMTETEAHDLRLDADFFMRNFAELSSKTRACVTSKWSSLADCLRRGETRRLISEGCSFTPESILANNQILIVAAPPKIFGSAGIFLNVLAKVGMQQALERRRVDRDTPPCLIAEDESHVLITEGRDSTFQTTARSSRTMVLKSTQSYVNYIAELGPHSEASVFSLIGSHQTIIFHQQSCTRQNQFASELLGQVKRFSVNLNHSFSDDDPWMMPMACGRGTTSSGVSEAFEPSVQPRVFTQLSKGGPPHFVAEAIVYQGGRSFPSTGAPWMFARIPQRL